MRYAATLCVAAGTKIATVRARGILCSLEVDKRILMLAACLIYFWEAFKCYCSDCGTNNPIHKRKNAIFLTLFPAITFPLLCSHWSRCWSWGLIGGFWALTTIFAMLQHRLPKPAVSPIQCRKPCLIFNRKKKNTWCPS